MRLLKWNYFFSNLVSHSLSNSPVLLLTHVLCAHSIANQSLVIISITPIKQANISADCGNYPSSHLQDS